MAPPPAKRQRRLNVLLSDDDDEPDFSNQSSSFLSSSKPSLRVSGINSNGRPPAEPRLSSLRSKAVSKLGKGTSRTATLKPSPKSSPEKRTKEGSRAKEEIRSRPLTSFFDRVNEEQRWNRKANNPVEDIDGGDIEDAIEDDDLPDEVFLKIVEDPDHRKDALDRRKRVSASTVVGVNAAADNFQSSNQKFVKPARPGSGTTSKTPNSVPPSHDISSLPWAERFPPKDLDELAVHRKKVTDVQKWLRDVLDGRDRHRMLVLKGPAGCGKTTTVNLLCQAAGYQTINWSNPSVAGAEANASFILQFDDFLNRGGRFGSLHFGNDPGDDAQNSGESNLGKRMLVVEEFPSAMTSSSSTLAAFRSVLVQYLATNSTGMTTMFDRNKVGVNPSPPIVMIVSESVLTSATAAADSFTAHRLLGSEISNHPSVTIMEFNPVAPTFVTKAVELIVRKEAKDSKRRRVPGPGIIKRLAEMGDIRSAVNALEFLCLRRGENEGWGGRVAAKLKKSEKEGTALTTMERNSLELVTQREATLGMFHAVGRVVYNKREDTDRSTPTAEPSPKPPNHLNHLDRPKASQVSVDDLMNETGTDIQTFLSTLHENYLLSCDGAMFVDSFNDCIHELTDSDLLNPESRQSAQHSRTGVGMGRGAFRASGVDMLRQNELSFNVAVRGLLFSLPNPVKRASHPGGRRGDSFKMFYPASLRLWKPTEEIDDLVSLHMRRLTSPEKPYGDGRLNGKSEGVESWKMRNQDFAEPHQGDVTDLRTPRVLASRADMILERLPYVTKIKSEESGSDKEMQQIRRITQFQGMEIQGDEDIPDQAELAESGGGADLPTEGESAGGSHSNSPKKRRTTFSILPVRGDDARENVLSASSGRAALSGLEKQISMEKLYISDDDIQDD